ncbi:hypothetical protein, conserved [Eimeria praecox]|uniref:Uncharacterized protein n=1 Tax=Eimeria praecox TaxID=51316 RepID=U6G9Y6_9EIME|nr:hypothetical protein, conserved [Eimeria praecox]
MALEERNRIQGWPLFADEAFHLIERLKIFVKSIPEYAAALLQGGELDPVTGEIHLNVYAEQVLESCSATLEERIAASLATGLRALPPQVDASGRNQRSRPNAPSGAVATLQPPPLHLSQEDEDYPVHRKPSVGVATRRQRAARLRTTARRNAVTQNPTDRRAAPPPQLVGSGGQEDLTLTLPPFEGNSGETQKSPESGISAYADVFAQAYAVSMGGLKAEADTAHKALPTAHSQEECWSSPSNPCKNPEMLPDLLPAAAGTVYLEGGADSSVSSRLVSMASSSYEDPEPLADSLGLAEQEPDALRDLLNCDVSEPTDTGVDWELEGSNTATIIDVSRPTRNPIFRQSRVF